MNDLGNRNFDVGEHADQSITMLLVANDCKGSDWAAHLRSAERPVPAQPRRWPWRTFRGGAFMITAQLPHRTVREKTVIAHVSIGVRDIDRSKPFYDAALEPLGYKCLRQARTLLGYGYGRESIALWVVSAERPVPADEKSGLHFCFVAPSRAAVDAFHAAALRAGGRDNGAPGLRTQYDPDYYAAFVVDPDGYRIEAYCGPAER